MLWLSVIFNLAVGLLFAGLLLRSVRRFERRADAMMARLDADDAESQRRFDEARDQIKTSMRRQIDQAIAEMQVSIQRLQVANMPRSLNGTNGHASPSATEKVVE